LASRDIDTRSSTVRLRPPRAIAILSGRSFVALGGVGDDRSRSFLDALARFEAGATTPTSVGQSRSSNTPSVTSQSDQAM
jgi:hypothetical protein